MTIARPNILPLGLITIALALTACGGGSGSGSGGSTTTSVSSKAESSLASSVPSSVASSIVATTSSSSSSADTTPAAFSFTATTDAALSTAIISGTITLSGFDATVPVSISAGEYSINGGTFTSAAGTISPTQTLAVKVVSSNTNSTAVDAIVTVGGVSATYRVTTLADAIPKAFTFTPVTNAALGSVHTSNAVMVAGIDTAAPIAITGGEYSINGGAFTSAASTVTNGQSIAVKAVAPAGTELTQNAVVTIGGVSGNYSITTILDTTAPVAEFKFPTPYTMSEANSVKVRGIATDEHAVTSVKVVVNGIDVSAIPKAPGDFSSWTADVPLTANSENEIKVVATDDRNNVTAINDANKVVIRQADVASAFPDESNQMDSPNSVLMLDNYEGRSRLLLIDGNGILAIDMITGQRTKFLENACSLSVAAIDPLTKHFFAGCEDGTLKEFKLSDGALVNEYDLTPFVRLASVETMEIDRTNGQSRLVFVEITDIGKVGFFSLDTKLFSVVSAEDQLPKIQTGGSVVIDGDYYLIPGGRFDSNFGGHIISIHATTGERKIISDNSIGSGDQYTGFIDDIRTAHLTAMVKDAKHNRLLAFEFWTNKIYSIDATTFNRKIFSDVSYKQQKDQEYEIGAFALQSDETAGHLYLVDWNRKSAIIVDSETGEKTILSKSKNDY